MLPADRALFERLGSRLRELREKAELTQEKAAEKAGFGGKYLGEIEKGMRDIPLSTLRAIVENGLGYELEAVFSASTRTAKRTRSRSQVGKLPRDVEITAELISRLPIASRRPLMALVKAMQTK